MQFRLSAVQIVGRLPGIVTVTPEGATETLDRMAALLLATLPLASGFRLAFVATTFFAVCFSNQFSFCSSAKSWRFQRDNFGACAGSG